jgi:hypothetical protein
LKERLPMYSLEFIVGCKFRSFRACFRNSDFGSTSELKVHLQTHQPLSSNVFTGLTVAADGGKASRIGVIFM